MIRPVIGALASACAAALALAACTSSTTGAGHGSHSASLATLTPPIVPATSQPPTSPTTSPTTSPPVSRSTSGSPAPHSSSGTTSNGTTATVRTIVRPVTPAGTAAPGWVVRVENTPVTCSPAEASPVALDPGVAYCSPSAAFAVACWPGGKGHVLCALDLAKRTLARYSLQGSFARTQATDRPVPFDLVLADGSTCTIRVGGTGTNLTDHPDWNQFYFCSGHTSVYGPQNGTGLDTAAPGWTVQIAPDDGEGSVHPVAVRAATFVGTAP